ncbi:cation:dicarboxylase symporter family transporter [Brucepastera parasyntrophica]|uniref:dicarboxylate/amino acid:cation symporter n=1 Tax=Brucepastera parasyntrophica TaxID=2880008 RepID=UPI00210BF675|nr:cation:dicarboxylase symporter family transporter [Brucepastera parasyntrophica]ULQ60938.1 cation:dicarboxylase symporter family transporter [Brucepastera parasyntrophica]
MKIWIKYLLGIVIGTAFALFFPQQNPAFRETVQFISDLVVQIGRYALYPVLFFSFTIAVYELRENRSLFRLGLVTVGIIVLAAVLLAVIGLISVLIRNPTRIPIFVEGTSEIPQLGIKESLRQLFPSSAFEVFSNGLFILPLCIFGGFAGAGCAVDKNASKATLNLFDSLSRVSYAVMCFFVDMLAIGMIAISVNWVFQFRTIISSKVFGSFIGLLLFDFFLLALVVYPLIIRLVCGKVNPYRILYAGIAPIVAAFFSGDTNMTLPVLIRHVNESLGVKRRVSSVTMPVFSIFGRAGSALTVTVSFIVILKSYSSLGIAFSDMLWLVGMAILLSFFLGRFPAGGAYIQLATICMLYGRGFEAGYLILKPAAFFICAIAAAIDALTSITGTYIIAHKWNLTSHRDLRFFI